MSAASPESSPANSMASSRSSLHGGRRRSTRVENPWVSYGLNLGKQSPRIDLTFMFSWRSWMLWSPVWLPMIFVITPPLSEYCNFRTFIFLLLFTRWNQSYLSQWNRLIKNKSWYSLLYAILVPRLWPTRIEIHCDGCEAQLAQQVRPEVQTVGWKLRCWRRFPWRIFSRQWGLIAHTQLKPHFLNTLLIYLYVWLFNCKVEEAEEENLNKYPSLGAFFTRRLKAGARPVRDDLPVVSPADGTTTFNGTFEGGFLEQVKGVHYSLSYFLGLRPPRGQSVLHGALPDASSLLHHKDGSTRLFQTVVYLSPGDYHRFHSPVQWTINTRR